MPLILIIDDDSGVRRNLASILQMEGYAVRDAGDGRAGLTMARAERPDLILCDVNMPGLDGHGVLTALRDDPGLEAVPFIFLSGCGERQDVRVGMNLGADDYITKPADGDEVLAAIRTRLARRDRMEASTRKRAEFRPDFSSPRPLAAAFGLTPREAEVLLWMAQGKTNAEIGSILGNAERTVKIHAGRVFDKLGVDNRHAAITRALETLVERPTLNAER